MPTTKWVILSKTAMQDHYTDFEHFVRDIQSATDEEVMRWLGKAAQNEVYKSITVSEIQKRGLEKLTDSSQRIERLTLWLIVLTVVLTLFTITLLIRDIVR